jgi:hypothetical protein
MQGYLLGRPMPPELIDAMMQKKNAGYAASPVLMTEV